MGYDVKMANIDAAYEQYIAYADLDGGELGEALASLREAVSAFGCMRSFKGDAAQALKSYVSETHSALIDCFIDLNGQLKQEYALSYMQRYYDAPLSESGGAVLPEDEMEQKRGLLARAKDERIPAIDADVFRANELLPSGSWPAIPAPCDLRDAFARVHDDVERVKACVMAIEEDAQRRFTDQSGSFSGLRDRMMSVIQDRSTGVDAILGGEVGSFYLSDPYIQMSIAAQRIQDERADRAEELCLAHDQMIDRQIVRAEERYAVFEEGRSQWELVGIGASIFSTIAGAAAIVGTSGMAAVVAGASTLRSASGVVTRIQDRVNDVHASDDPAGTDMGSGRTSAVSTTAVSAVSSVLALKGSGDGASLPKAIASTSSIVSKALSAVTIFADANHDRMRADAQAELARIEELKAKKMAAA